MTTFPSAAIFLIASTVAAWLRFDKGLVATSWIVMLLGLAGTMASWLFEVRRVPRLAIPDYVEPAGSPSLTAEERFVEALRADHRQRQLETWRDIKRRGPGSLIGPRAAFYYFWLCVFVLAVVPPSTVPRDLLPQLPRFSVVLLSLAGLAVTIAVPLGLRDWTGVQRSLRKWEGIDA
jgi:hypothetical protein